MMTKRIKNTVERLSGLPKVSVIYNGTRSVTLETNTLTITPPMRLLRKCTKCWENL